MTKTLDLNKFDRRHDFDLETQSLGKIRCGTLKVSTLSATAKSLVNPNDDALLQCRNILQRVGKRIVLSGDNQHVDETALSDDDIRQVTDEEVEFFSKEFVSHNDWLLRSRENMNDSEGSNEDKKSGPEASDLTQSGMETNSEYLIRILYRYFEDQGARLKKMLEPLSKGVASFSINEQIKQLMEPLSAKLSSGVFDASTLESLRQNLSLSDQLKDSLRAFEKNTVARELLPDTKSLEITHVQPMRFPENPLVETNKRLGSMLDQMGEMRTLVAQSAELIANMNHTALQMQANFINNARSTQKSTIVAIVIAVLSLLSSSVFSWLSYRDGKDQSEKNNVQIKLYQAEVSKLIEAHEKDRAIILEALKTSSQIDARPAARTIGSK